MEKARMLVKTTRRLTAATPYWSTAPTHDQGHGLGPLDRVRRNSCGIVPRRQRNSRVKALWS
jgi:hypothetical protein